MKLHKKIIIGFHLILLLSFIILIGYIEINRSLNKPLNFSELIEHGKLDDLSLTIYYMDPQILTMIPTSLHELTSGDDNKIIIKGRSLKKHITLLKKLSNYVVIPDKYNSREDARIYYVFKTHNNQKIYDVCMWGENNSIFVNGKQVKENDIFYDVIMPFVPKDIAKVLKSEKASMHEGSPNS